MNHKLNIFDRLRLFLYFILGFNIFKIKLENNKEKNQLVPIFKYVLEVYKLQLT